MSDMHIDPEYDTLAETMVEFNQASDADIDKILNEIGATVEEPQASDAEIDAILYEIGATAGEPKASDAEIDAILYEIGATAQEPQAPLVVHGGSVFLCRPPADATDDELLIVASRDLTGQQQFWKHRAAQIAQEAKRQQDKVLRRQRKEERRRQQQAGQLPEQLAPPTKKSNRKGMQIGYRQSLDYHKKNCLPESGCIRGPMGGCMFSDVRRAELLKTWDRVKNTDPKYFGEVLHKNRLWGHMTDSPRWSHPYVKGDCGFLCAERARCGHE